MPIKTFDIAPTTLFRATSLQYYRYGISAVGARKASGRFNEHDISAIYLAFDPATALAEYYNGDPPTPAVVLPVAVEAINVVDLTGKLGRFPAHWRDWDSDWTLARDNYEAGDKTATCSSWKCGSDARERNLTGIVFPSTKVSSGGLNVVLYPEHAIAGALKCDVFDPGGEILKANPPKAGK